MRTERETEYLLLSKAAKRLGVGERMARHWLEIGLLKGKLLPTTAGRQTWKVTAESVDRLAVRHAAMRDAYESGGLINKSEASRILGVGWRTLANIIIRGDLEVVGKWRRWPLLRRSDVERYKAEHPGDRHPWTRMLGEGTVLCQRCKIVVQPGQTYCPDCVREQAGGGYRWYEVQARPASSVGRVVYGR